jgi:CHAD domain-containing protein
MALRLEESEPLQTGLRRISVETIDAALAALDEPEGRDVAIHTIRKQSKKIRAILRLFRDGLGSRGRKESRVFRDLSRSLSSARDVKVALDVHAMLLDRYGTVLAPSVGVTIRQQLVAGRQARRGGSVSSIQSPNNDALRQSLLAARLRARRWRLVGREDDLLKQGLGRTYRRGRAALRHAVSSGAAGDLHEARKRAKDYWYQLEIVARSWPDVALTRIARAHQLTDKLGEAHDLDIYRDAIRRAASARCPRGVEMLSAIAEQRRRELESEALDLGEDVFQQKPKRFVAELERSQIRQQAAG